MKTNITFLLQLSSTPCNFDDNSRGSHTQKPWISYDSPDQPQDHTSTRQKGDQPLFYYFLWIFVVVFWRTPDLRNLIANVHVVAAGGGVDATETPQLTDGKCKRFKNAKW